VDNKNGSGSYQGDSEGEKSRADLAINFAISDLVATRAKKSYPQRFFDEPFESLDEAGVEAVMGLLTKLSKDCGSIFVITHQPNMKSLFNKSITMIKENGLTRVLL
jgi:DNA repair exonuclease SbcCD ATPase subunit